jgi:hypothetical protein
MNASVRLMPTKFAAAALAAGVVAAGSSIGPIGAERALPTIEANVANTSVVTDALYNVGSFIDGVNWGVALPIEAVVSLPFDTLAALAAAVQSPVDAPSALSYLINRYANPSESYVQNFYYTYPWDFKVSAIDDGIAIALPFPLGSSATEQGLIPGIADGIANVIGNALAGLPDPTAGAGATFTFWATPAGGILNSVNNALLAPVLALARVVEYAGFLPYNVEATIESAIQSPQEIPGLVSNLAYGLLGSDAQRGLAGILVNDLSSPLTVLPGAIGQLSTNVVANIQLGLENLLAHLPAPIEPTPLAAVAAKLAAAVPAGADQGVGGDISAANGPSAKALKLTLPGTRKAAESKPEAQGGTTDAGAAAAGSSADGHDGGATAAAGTNEKPVKSAGKVKSGNKVLSGRKSAQGSAATGRVNKSTAPGGTHSDSSGSGAGSHHPGAAA